MSRKQSLGGGLAALGLARAPPSAIRSGAPAASKKARRKPTSTRCDTRSEASTRGYRHPQQQQCTAPTTSRRNSREGLIELLKITLAAEKSAESRQLDEVSRRSRLPTGETKELGPFRA